MVDDSTLEIKDKTVRLFWRFCLLGRVFGRAASREKIVQGFVLHQKRRMSG
jgi:hypothetical protein